MSLTWAPGVAMSKEEIDNFLRQKLVARLTSIRPDGYPHTTPLWYVGNAPDNILVRLSPRLL